MTLPYLGFIIAAEVRFFSSSKLSYALIKRCPQGLKPSFECSAYGTAEAVPFLQRLFSKKNWKMCSRA
jgi:hypothetical protein